jgi:hypothetical protein
MPATAADGSPRRHFAAASAGVIEARQGPANTLVCRETDAQAAFKLYMNTLTGGEPENE